MPSAARQPHCADIGNFIWWSLHGHLAAMPDQLNELKIVMTEMHVCLTWWGRQKQTNAFLRRQNVEPDISFCFLCENPELAFQHQCVGCKLIFNNCDKWCPCDGCMMLFALSKQGQIFLWISVDVFVCHCTEAQLSKLEFHSQLINQLFCDPSCHKDGSETTQIWHAMSAIKMFWSKQNISDWIWDKPTNIPNNAQKLEAATILSALPNLPFDCNGLVDFHFSWRWRKVLFYCTQCGRADLFQPKRKTQTSVVLQGNGIHFCRVRAAEQISQSSDASIYLNVPNLSNSFYEVKVVLIAVSKSLKLMMEIQQLLYLWVQ